MSRGLYNLLKNIIVYGMEFVNFETTNNDCNRRFDTLIRKFLPEMPLSLVYKNIRTGFIRLNDKKTKQETKIKLGDVINIEKRLYNNFSKQNKEINLSDEYEKNKKFIENITIFKNESILILDKPYNFNVQNSENDKNSLDTIIKSIYQKDSLTFLPGAMHRLDKLTTGVLCFSQNLDCARWFSEQISKHFIQKEYFAILEGNLTNKQEWVDYISSDNNKNNHKSRIVESENGKKSVTIIEPLSHGKYKNIDITFAKISIKTGRKHQIRLQCSNKGFPILNDSLYGSKISKQKNDLEQKLYLHCFHLGFPDNNFDIPSNIIAKIPNSFEKALKKCLIEITNQVYNV